MDVVVGAESKIAAQLSGSYSVTLVAICLQMAVLIRRLHAGYQKPADLLVVCRVGCGEHVGSRPNKDCCLQSHCVTFPAVRV